MLASADCQSGETVIMARNGKGKSNRRITTKPTLAPLPSLVGPPQVQIDNNRVAKAEWADPDASPRGPVKTVKSWRTSCPIRRMATSLNSTGKITREHIAAADRLRGLWDVAMIGLSGRRMPWVYLERSMTMPTTPTPTALRQTRAYARVRRCLQLFSPAQQELIHGVVLDCVPVARWAREHGRCCPNTAIKRLIEVLDRLVVHFCHEITRHGLPA
jgi:hypothetical protein